MRIHLFGEVRADDAHGAAIELGSPKCRAVLAALALSAGQPVPVARLVDLVWGSTPPRTAEKTLQSYVTALRKGLGPDAIVRVGSAYRLDVAPASVDVLRFERLLTAGDVTGALDEWAGTPLAGLEVGGLAAAVDGLVERWLGAVEADMEQRLERGGPDAAATVAELTELTARYPFREGLWALLMAVLYREGRQAEALAAYRRARHHLVEDLGVEPGPRLRELEAAILGHDDRLAVEPVHRADRPTIPTGTVTFAFCELDVDHAAGPGSSRNGGVPVQARFEQQVRSSASAHGGHLFSTGFNSFGLAFDRATAAVAWAEELQGAIGPLRLAIATGEADEHGGRYYSPAVNAASRLGSVGHPGQILVGAVTAALADGRRFRDLGTFRLEGVVTDQRVLQLGDADHPPLRTGDGTGGNLPRRPRRLIGRERALKELLENLEQAPVVTLLGPGGIGKTSLATAAGQRLAADQRIEVWLIDLARISSSDDVGRAIADTLDLAERPGRTIIQSVVEALSARRALLVLDNCEHVIDGAAEMARSLVESCLEVRILATSREGLGLLDELQVPLAPLDPAGPGVELFIERATAVSEFDGEGLRDDVEQICRRLDGLPLAIELAAARTTTLSTTDLLARLDDQLSLLAGARRDGVERHRTLRATIAWSYELLSGDQRLLFRRLSAFVGPFDLSGAERVAAAGEIATVDVDRLLSAMVAQSMVTAESGLFGRRFRLLEPLRRFGAEQLIGSGEAEAVAERHAAWCRDAVVSIGDLLAGQAEIEGAARLDELWPNLRAAFEWACTADRPGLARDLLEPIVAEIYMRNRTEIGHWAERLLQIAPADDSELITFGVIWAGRRYMVGQDPDGYEDLVARNGDPDHPLIRYGRAFVRADMEERATLAPQVVDVLIDEGRHHLAALFEVVGVGLTLLTMGRFEEHDDHVIPLVDRYRAEGPPTCLNWALVFLATTAAMRGEREARNRYLAEAAEVDLPERTRNWNKPIEARAQFRRGNRARAMRILGEHVGELLEAGDMHGGRLACSEFVSMMAAAGHRDEARHILAFIETTDLLDTATTGSELTTAIRILGRDDDVDQDGTDLDDRAALVYINDTLARLAPEA